MILFSAKHAPLSEMHDSIEDGEVDNYFENMNSE